MVHGIVRAIRFATALTCISVLAGCASTLLIRQGANPCSGLLAEATVLLPDFADSNAARVATAHAAYATKTAQYHACLAENRFEP